LQGFSTALPGVYAYNLEGPFMEFASTFLHAMPEGGMGPVKMLCQRHPSLTSCTPTATGQNFMRPQEYR
jgi:hypothetical protein